MDDQNAKLAEKVKEARHKVAAAKHEVIICFGKFPFYGTNVCISLFL